MKTILYNSVTAQVIVFGAFCAAVSWFGFGAVLANAQI